MELYKEKLENLKKVERSLNKVQNAFEKAKKDLEEYVKVNIVSGKYTIGSKELKYGYKLFYPVLNFPEGIKMQSETFWCNYEEEHCGLTGDDDGLEVVHNYILLDEKQNIEINVTEKSTRGKLVYGDNLGNWLKIKNKINVMEDRICYDIKIGEMEFHFTRNFGDNIKKSFLINLLKDKHICYKDFKETPTCNRTKFTSRYCDNRRLKEGKRDWKKILKNYQDTINTFYGDFFYYCDFDKIISDIEQILIQGEYEKNPITKLYYLKEGCTLIVSVVEKDNDSHCIYYEDELMILELNTPFNKQTNVQFGYAEQSYEENLDIHALKNQKGKIETLMLKIKEIDMNKSMSVLEIFHLG